MKVSKELINCYLSYRWKKDGRRGRNYVKKDFKIKKYYQPPLFVINDKKC